MEGAKPSRSSFKGAKAVCFPRPLSCWPQTERKNMNKIYILPKDELGGELYRRICLLISKNRWTRQSIGAAFGLAGGMLSIILGAVLWAIIQLLAPGSFGSFLNGLEIVFFALALPLLALGAYCLDLLETKASILPLHAKSPPVGFERLLHLRPQHLHKN